MVEEMNRRRWPLASTMLLYFKLPIRPENSLLLTSGSLGSLCCGTSNLLGGGGLDNTDSNSLNKLEYLKKSY